MKKTILILTAILFVVTTSLFAQKTEKPVKENKKISEVNLTCQLDCGNCANEVKKQLAFTKGVKSVETDVEKNTILVKYRNDKTDSEKIISSLAEIDYKASVKKACCPGKKTGCSSAKTEKTGSDSKNATVEKKTGCGSATPHTGCGGEK